MRLIVVVEYINPIKILIAAVACYGYFGLDRSKPLNAILCGILLLNLLTEIIHSFFRYYEINLGLTTTISVTVHHVLWLIILLRIGVHRTMIIAFTLSFIMFSLVNFLFIEGPAVFNYWSFVLGGVLYIIGFFSESVHQLKKENLPFFQNHQYILIFAPILFLSGGILMFGFKSVAVTSTVIYGKLTLYTLIMHFVNLCYYSLVAVYIHREKSLK
ncbi:MAG TPA: hypothetical protein VF676_01995 [Flavobacterium sp.]|jgi:hypothetical protein